MSQLDIFNIASPDAGERGDGRMGTDPVRTDPESDGEGSGDGRVKPRSQITELPGETFEDIFRCPYDAIDESAGVRDAAH